MNSPLMAQTLTSERANKGEIGRLAGKVCQVAYVG
jgi:hypothetical protein